jgi:hypothetical protein
MIRLVLISYTFASFCFGTPDGAWNGNPWPKDKLEEATKNGDPEALAEMAYCVMMGVGDVKHDNTHAAALSKRSSDAANPYGQAIYARLVGLGMGAKKNPAKGEALSKKSADAGHPLGLRVYANALQEKGSGSDQDNQNWKKRMTESASKGCIMAETNLIKSHYFGTNGFKKDRDKAHRLSVEAINRVPVPDYIPVQLIIRMGKDKLRADYGIDDETWDQLLGRLEMAARSGIIESRVILGSYLCKFGETERGLPMIIREAEGGSGFASGVLLDEVSSWSDRRRSGVGSQFSTVYRISRRAYEGGYRNHNVYQYAGESYVFKFSKELPDPAKALEIAQEMVRDNFICTHVSQIMARVFFSDVSGELKDKDRGVAHYIVGSKSRGGMTAKLAHYLWTEDGENKNTVEAYAAACAVETSNPFNKKLKAEIETVITDEQREAAEILISKNYPKADEFREKSLIKLIEYGDIPKGTGLERFDR